MGGSPRALGGERRMKRENEVLNYIRANVTLERIEEAKEACASAVDLNEYFDEHTPMLMETVYRSHKGSYKIDSSKVRGLTFLGFILYILFGEPKFNPNEVIADREKRKLMKVLVRRFDEDSYFLRYSKKFFDVKTGDRDEKSGWVNIEPYVYPLLGGEIFFYCTLKALIEISEKALTDEKYDYLPLMNWKEGIVEYLVHEAISEENIP